MGPGDRAAAGARLRGPGGPVGLTIADERSIQDRASQRTSVRRIVGAGATLESLERAQGYPAGPLDPTRTTAAVQLFLDELQTRSGDQSAALAVRALLERAAKRLQILCASALYRSYPRLARPPLNLQTDEMLGAVVERLMKALQGTRPGNVRQFFALANVHMRWELNELARRLDERSPQVTIREESVAEQNVVSDTGRSHHMGRILEAIENLPEDQREAFSLVRIQGLSHGEAAEILKVSTKTVQRRVNRSLIALAQQLDDLRVRGDTQG